MKYIVESYAPNDLQDFKKLNRDSAWENKILLPLVGFPFLQNRPPGAVVAINKVYARAAAAIDHSLYHFSALGNDKYCVSNQKNGNSYSFILKKADCSCVDLTNV